MDVTQPYELIRFGAMDVTEARELMYGLGTAMAPNPMNLYGLCFLSSDFFCFVPPHSTAARVDLKAKHGRCTH